jgi:hypothetical protein
MRFAPVIGPMTATYIRRSSSARVENKIGLNRDGCEAGFGFSLARLFPSSSYG